MTPDQKESASNRQRAHWDKCRAVAKACDLKPGEVNRFWSRIKSFYEDTEKVKAHLLQASMQRTARENYRTMHNPARRKEKPKNLTQAVRVMVWAIDTIDDLNMAKEAFDKAYQAVGKESDDC